MKCIRCGAGLGMFKKHVALSDGALCLNCFEELGFDKKDKDLYSFVSYDQIAGGYEHYIKKLIGDVDEPELKPTLKLPVAGFDFKQEELKSLLTEENYEYALPKDEFMVDVGQKAYEYETAYYPAELVPEPDNEYDPNAIAVYVDDIHIGYVARKDQAAIDYDAIVTVVVEIYGGKYKDVDWADNKVVTGKTPYKAMLLIETQ